MTFKLETVTYAEVGAIKTVHSVKGSWEEFVSEMQGDAFSHGNIFEHKGLGSFSILKMDEPISLYTFVSGDYHLILGGTSFIVEVCVATKEAASTHREKRAGTWLRFVQSMEDHCVNVGETFEQEKTTGAFTISTVQGVQKYYTFVEGDFDEAKDNGPGVVAVPVDVKGFDYDYAVSLNGQQDTERRHSDRTWAEYMQGHADLALNTGTIFNQTGPDDFTVSDGKGRVERHTFLSGAYGAAKQRHIPRLVDERISWDEYGMQLATATALRADCTRRRVGAVLMGADHSIISMGYNGGPPKGPSCLKGECPRGRLTKEELPADAPYDTGGGTCVALHAEWNVMLRTAWHQFEGSTLYVTEVPCHICQVMIKGTAISRIVAPQFDWRKK